MPEQNYDLNVNIKVNQELASAIQQLKRLKSIRSSISGKVNLVQDSDVKGLGDLLNKTEKVTLAIKDQKREVTEITKLKEKLVKAQSKEGKEADKLKVKISEQTRANKLAAKQDTVRISNYQKLSKRLKENKDRVKDLLLENKKLTASDKLLIKETQKLDQQLKNVDKTVGDHQRNVGNYTGSILDASRSIPGLGAGVGALQGVFSGLNKIFAPILANFKALIASMFASNTVQAESVIVGEAQAATTGTQAIATTELTTATNAQTSATTRAAIATKLLNNVLKASGIFLLIAALSSLVVAFTQTQEGADDVSVKMEGLKTAASEVIGAIGSLGFGVFNFIKGTVNSIAILVKQAQLGGKELKLIAQEAKEYFAGGVGSAETRKEIEALRTEIDLLAEDDSFAKAGASFDEFADKMNKVGEAFDIGVQLGIFKLEIRELTLFLREELIDIGTALALVQQKAQDTTIGLKDRIAAQREVIRLQEEFSRREIAIAEGNVQIAAEELRIATEAGVKNIELREALLEAQEQLDEKTTGLLLAQERDRIFSRELLLKDLTIRLKAQQKFVSVVGTVLTKDITNTKISIAEKDKLVKQLQGSSQRSFDAQIKSIENVTGVTIDANDLVAESDAFTLDQKIRSLNLSEVAYKSLAKTIAKRVDQLGIEADLDKKTTLLITQKTLALMALRAESEKLDIEGQIADLKNQNKAQDENISLQVTNNKKIFDLRKELLEDQAALAIEKANETIIEEDVRAAKILNINKKLANDLKNLAVDRINTVDALEQARLNKRISDADKVVSAVDKALDKRSNENLARIDKEISAQDKALAKQESRGERGLENEVELQQRKAAELEAERVKEQEKEARRQKILSFWSIFSGYAKQDANTALQKAAKDIAIGEAISIAFAEEGGIVGDVSATTTLKDGKLSRKHKGGDIFTVLSPREGIITEPEMAKLGGPAGFDKLRNAIDKDILFPSVPIFSKGTATSNYSELLHEIKELKKVVSDKPVSLSRIDNVGDVINTTVEDGVKHIRKVISNKPAFRR